MYTKRGVNSLCQQLRQVSKCLSFTGNHNVSPAFATLAYEEIIVPGKSAVQENSSEVSKGQASPSDGESLCTALIIHGLFGTGRNWRTPSKALAELAVKMSRTGSPGWRLVLVDLRNHGKSARLDDFLPPHTIQAAGRDVVDLVAGSGWGGASVVIGHSLGGKVALEYAQLTGTSGAATDVKPAEQVWILDSVPGPVVDQGGDVEKVLATLRSLPDPVPSRRWLLGHLQELGYSRGLSEWMASNLRKPDAPASGEEMTWVFNVEGAAQMYNSYRASGYLPLLEHPPPSMRLDFVRAEKSDRWNPEVLRPIEAAAARRYEGQSATGVGLHVLPNAGHWLHMDNPKGLVELLAPSMTKVAEKSKK